MTDPRMLPGVDPADTTRREAFAERLLRLLPKRLGRSALQRSLLTATFWTMVLNGVLAAFTLVITFVLSRLLGADSYGSYAFVVGLATVLAVPASLGASPLLVRSVSTYRTRSQWGLLRGVVRAAHLAVIPVSIAVAAVAAAGGAPFIARAGTTPLHAYLPGLLLAPLLALAMLRQSVMQGLGHVVAGRIPETLLQPLLLLLLVGGVNAVSPAALGAPLAVALHVASAAAALVVGWAMLRHFMPAAVHHAHAAYDTGDWARRIPPLVLLGGMTIFNVHAGVIMLGILRFPLLSGIYQVASRTAGLVGFVFIAATFALMPAVSQLYAEGNIARLQRLLVRSVRFLLLSSVAVAVPLMLGANRWLALFGDRFPEGRTALVILAVGELLNVATGLNAHTLIMTGHEGEATRVVALAGAAQLVLGSVFVSLWGLNGAAVASASSRALSNVAMTWLLWRRLGLVSLPFRVPKYARRVPRDQRERREPPPELD